VPALHLRLHTDQQAGEDEPGGENFGHDRPGTWVGMDHRGWQDREAGLRPWPAGTVRRLIPPADESQTTAQPSPLGRGGWSVFCCRQRWSLAYHQLDLELLFSVARRHNLLFC
ncbi:MAG: hypothetical protein GTO53_03405, partial [Planctomycetales bacterium]|nr:hypothetical protein [Planctomycetales bacterium]NIN07706.1 hypothetical protein [Planctomycetales bacterium]NIN76832.1 hypothetical protein [Planctomycetales bacterium]NIO34028.1 hypothetical protein [Planctomycetales bacterium]NIO45817.1 hypothetical protein [Planctomycetales bacterium]